MGSWGIRAHESDTGSSFLSVVTERYLRGVKFKTFHVKHITELLRSHILEACSTGPEPNVWSEQDIAEHILKIFRDYPAPK